MKILGSSITFGISTPSQYALAMRVVRSANIIEILVLPLVDHTRLGGASRTANREFLRAAIT